MTASAYPVRQRSDRCPGILRPWPAEDGLLIRLRLVGGRVSLSCLEGLAALAREHGDGDMHLTNRANLQLRAMPAEDGRLPKALVQRVQALGLLPHPSHELVRNFMVSPQSGLAGGRVDLRPVAEDLDRRLCADADLATLSGKFLFVLDDGRGDLAEHWCDLGLVAVSAQEVQLRVGDAFGTVVPLAEASATVHALARAFCAARGQGPTAAWHVSELAHPLHESLQDPGHEPHQADPRIPAAIEALPYGEVPGGVHVPAPDGIVNLDALRGADELVVTPWHGILIPTQQGTL